MNLSFLLVGKVLKTELMLQPQLGVVGLLGVTILPHQAEVIQFEMML